MQEGKAIIYLCIFEFPLKKAEPSNYKGQEPHIVVTMEALGKKKELSFDVIVSSFNN